MKKKAYPDKRRWNELKTACKERAGWQCEYVYPNGKRCSMREDEIRKSRRRQGKPCMVHLHAAHLGNANPGDPNRELICLCPKHHMQMDRRIELREKLSTRRRGYQITTDLLLEEINTAGITVEACSDGYSWRIDGTDIAGRQTTAVAAIGVAIHQMRCLLDMTRRALDAAGQQFEQCERGRRAIHV